MCIYLMAYLFAFETRLQTIPPLTAEFNHKELSEQFSSGHAPYNLM